MQASHYFKEYSHALGREMEFEVYGFGGKPCIVFPCQNGRFFDYNSFKMTDNIADWINSGRIQLFCVDSVDLETWSDVDGDPRRRGEMLEKWYHYIADELVPRIREVTEYAAAKVQNNILHHAASLGRKGLNKLIRHRHTQHHKQRKKQQCMTPETAANAACQSIHTGT